MSTFLTNDFLQNSNVIDLKLKTERDKTAIFIEYHVYQKKSYGCVFTYKRRDEYQCKVCRKICDQNRYKIKKAKKISDPTNIESEFSELNYERPSSCIINDDLLTWIKSKHVEKCALITKGAAAANSYKNLAVIHKSHFPCSSKEAYDSHSRYLKRDMGADICMMDLVEQFPPFEKMKSALDKARKYLIFK